MCLVYTIQYTLSIITKGKATIDCMCDEILLFYFIKCLIRFNRKVVEE